MDSARTHQLTQSTLPARLAIAAGALFLVLLAALHPLRPDLGPAWHFISDYEIGPWGWVMNTAFLSLALSCFATLAALLPHARGIIGRLGLLLLLTSACGIALAGIFIPSTTNTLHETGAMLDQLPLAALLITISLWRNQTWRPHRWTLLWSLLILWAAMAAFIAAMAVYQPSKDTPPSPDVLIGWPSRLLIVAHVAWLFPVARAVLRTTLPGARSTSTSLAPPRTRRPLSWCLDTPYLDAGTGKV